MRGCTDPDALNYNPDATIDDGSCEYAPLVEVRGCTDPDALNYNPDATIDDGSCEYAPLVEVRGCTDPAAINYNPDATVSDDSCLYGPGPVNTAPEMNPILDRSVDEGNSLSFAVSATDAEGDDLTYVARTECTGFACWVLEHVWYDELDTVLPEGAELNPQTGEFIFSPDFDFVAHPETQKLVELRFLAWDGENFSDWEPVVITVNDVNQLPQIVSLIVPETLMVGEEGLFRVVADDPDGDSLAYTWSFGDGSLSHEADATHRYNLPGMYTLTLTIDDGFGALTLSRTVMVTAMPAEEVPGCTDPTALNFNPAATFNDGSCRHIVPIRGCTDPDALNYHAEAILDDDSCRYPPQDGIRIMSAEVVDEEVEAGGSVMISIRVRNEGNQTHKLQARALIYELSVMGYSRQFRLDGGENTRQPVFLELPEYIKPGSYLVKVYVGDEYLHEVTHRQITVR